MNLDLREIPAVYINLEKDVDRNESIKSVLTECGFKNIIRLNAECFPDRPLAGCSLSHYNALNEIEPPHIVAIQENILTPVGTAITMVAAVKYALVSTDKPTVYM